MNVESVGSSGSGNLPHKKPNEGKEKAPKKETPKFQTPVDAAKEETRKKIKQKGLGEGFDEYA